MLPRDLQSEQFASYPPEARKAVGQNLDTLRRLPISFLPGFLREVIEYDFKFPAERASIDDELAILSNLSPAQMTEWFEGFAVLNTSTELEEFDWINHPAQFVERQSAYLWSSRQLDAFRKAASEYGARVQSKAPARELPVVRLGIAVVGQGVAAYDEPLFAHLRTQGTYFDHVKPDNGLALLLGAVADRAKTHPVPYGHWYIDGGEPVPGDPQITTVSYSGVGFARASLLRYVQSEIEQPGMGPEELHTKMARLEPSDLGFAKGSDGVLDRFQLKVLTEGSGTQIFSTTFAQWAAREALRRAQPLTLLVRFAPRQRQRSLNELLSSSPAPSEVDAVGSLVDAEMAAYYQWINQQRLPGYQRSVFLAWFEGHSQAVLVAPTLPRGATSASSLDLGQLLSLATT
jgi:hypothetical protein